jgi:hypothetical protein
MRRELVAGVDAAGPTITLGVEAHLISLGRVDALKANLCRADG